MNSGPVNPANLPPCPPTSSLVPWVIGGFACLLLFLGLAGGIGAFVYRAELSEMFPQTQMPGPNPATVGCPGEHTLAEFSTPSGSTYSCNVCGQTFPPRTRMFGCRICNWDVCEHCASGP